MNKTQASRLLTLARFLRNEVDPKNFDMNSYYDKLGCENGWIPNLKEPKCGTTACALGWCSRIWPKLFRLKNGFCLFSVNETFVSIGMFESAIANFFGLRCIDVSTLFYPERDRTPKQEAKSIERFVKSKGWVYDDE